jgi:hypothetical protein
MPGVDAQVIYDAIKGEITLDPNGISSGVGLFDLQSTSGIFTGTDPTFPPDGILTNDFDTRISWAALQASAFTQPFNLGPVAQPGINPSLLFADLTGTYSGGLGTPNRELSFACINCSDDPEPPIAMDAALTALPGETVVHNFQATDPNDPPESLVWSDLILNAGALIIAPTLGADGSFSWDSTGSPVGLYAWSATVTNSSGLSDLAALQVIVVVPEPASAVLTGLVVTVFFWIRRR